MALDIQEFKAKVGTGSRLGRLWRWGRHPATIPIILQAPFPLTQVEAVCQLFPNINCEEAESCRLDLLRNNTFFNELNRNYVEKRFRRTTCDGWNEFLYMAVRFARPAVVVETGVFDGISSSVILQALTDNERGQLLSIDLPARNPIQKSTDRMIETSLPPNTPPGWVIPNYLKQRHRLILGDSREQLPKLLNDYPSIDIFFHDSLHTFEHQYFEYSTAWPHLTEGGLLLSDDIFWNSAFHKFCRDQGKTYLNVDGFGAIKK